MAITYQEALNTVRAKLGEARPHPLVESVALAGAAGRILAEDARADRDYPPFNRSTRDGFAVLAADVASAPAWLEVVGEARAGAPFTGTLAGRRGVAVRIMTGAPLPAEADAVVMQEYTRVEGGRVEVLRSVARGENVIRQGSEARAGGVVLARGRWIGPGEVGLLASVGQSRLRVFARPQVAILSTGDEVVPVDRQPEWYQVRNGNALALAAQVEAAGGTARVLEIAPDDPVALRRLLEDGLRADLLVITGGISVGKYDFVQPALRDLGTEFFFHGVAIRPGKPTAFGRARGKFVFGLPGHPVSTFVTFELFVRPAIRLLAGAEFEAPIFLRARLGKALQNRTGLTTFMPARVESGSGEPVINLVAWQGSGDLVGVAAANCFLVMRPEQTELEQGAWVDVLPKPL